MKRIFIGGNAVRLLLLILFVGNVWAQGVNVAIMEPRKAKQYAQKYLGGKDLKEFKDKKKDDIITPLMSNFKQNYSSVYNKCQESKAAGLLYKRIDMPVVNSDQIKGFKDSLVAGDIDIKAPFIDKVDLGKVTTEQKDQIKNALQKFRKNGTYEYFPKNLSKDKDALWLKLGQLDGAAGDDVVKVEKEFKDIPAQNMWPIQSEIWLNLVLDNIAKYGLVKKGSPALGSDKNLIIVVKPSADEKYYILDGHHRWMQTMLSDPNLSLRVMVINDPSIKVDTFIQAARSYGNAIGNSQNP